MESGAEEQCQGAWIRNEDVLKDMNIIKGRLCVEGKGIANEKKRNEVVWFGYLI